MKWPIKTGVLSAFFLLLWWVFLRTPLGVLASDTLPSLPDVAIVDKMVLARADTGERGGSNLWIVCSEQQLPLLALHTKFLPEEPYLRKGLHLKQQAQFSFWRDEAQSLQNVLNSPRFEFRDATFQRREESDVLFTPYLSKDETDKLLRWYREYPGAVHISAMESGRLLRSIASVEAISRFLRQCLPDRRLY